MHITHLIKLLIVINSYCCFLDALNTDSEDKVSSDLPVEDFLYSAGGGFLFGAIAGYA